MSISKLWNSWMLCLFYGNYMQLDAQCETCNYPKYMCSLPTNKYKILIRRLPNQLASPWRRDKRLCRIVKIETDDNSCLQEIKKKPRTLRFVFGAKCWRISAGSLWAHKVEYIHNIYNIIYNKQMPASDNSGLFLGRPLILLVCVALLLLTPKRMLMDSRTVGLFGCCRKTWPFFANVCAVALFVWIAHDQFSILGFSSKTIWWYDAISSWC